jgi:hypothetical protein
LLLTFAGLCFIYHVAIIAKVSISYIRIDPRHVKNQIKQFRPIEKDEKLSVFSCFDDFGSHSKGWLFSIRVEFYYGSELLWQSISTNFFRANHGHVVDPTNQHSMVNFINPIIQPISLVLIWVLGMQKCLGI